MCTKLKIFVWYKAHWKKITYKLEKLRFNNEVPIWYLWDVLMTLCVFH